MRESKQDAGAIIYHNISKIIATSNRERKQAGSRSYNISEYKQIYSQKPLGKEARRKQKL